MDDEAFTFATTIFLKFLVSTARERKRLALAGAEKCDGFCHTTTALVRRPALDGSAVK